MKKTKQLKRANRGLQEFQRFLDLGGSLVDTSETYEYDKKGILGSIGFQCLPHVSCKGCLFLNKSGKDCSVGKFKRFLKGHLLILFCINLEEHDNNS